MGYKDVRRGKTQAEFNESASQFLFGEITILAIIVGLVTSSLAVGGIVFLLLIAITWFRKGAILLTILLSIAWGVIGFIIGSNVGGLIAGLVIGIIALLVSGSAHVGAIEWMDDIRYEEDN